EKLTQPTVNIPVDPAKVVALGIALEIGKLRRRTTPLRAMLASQPMRHRRIRKQRQLSQASQQLLIEHHLLARGRDGMLVRRNRSAKSVSNGREQTVHQPSS